MFVLHSWPFNNSGCCRTIFSVYFAHFLFRKTSHFSLCVKHRSGPSSGHSLSHEDHCSPGLGLLAQAVQRDRRNEGGSEAAAVKGCSAFIPVNWNISTRSLLP